MNPELITQIQTALAPIAEKFGQGAAFGWETVVRQQVAVGVVDLLFAVTGLVAFIASFKIWERVKEDDDYTPIAFLCSAISAMLFLVAGRAGILHLINPDYYAIKFFLELVK